MKVIFTEQALSRLESTCHFLENVEKIPPNKILFLKRKLINKEKSLSKQPFKGQKEDYLTYLNSNHRRLIEGNFKIIYKVDQEQIFILDFFDTQREPSQMKY